jgi:hypothetical protein
LILFQIPKQLNRQTQNACPAMNTLNDLYQKQNVGSYFFSLRIRQRHNVTLLFHELGNCIPGCTTRMQPCVTP